MRLRWDSGVARDIITELDRIEQELDDCVQEVNRGAGILAQMQGGELSKAIEKYVSAAGKIGTSLKQLAEACNGTSRSVIRADELFDGFERQLRGRVEAMGSAGAPPEAGGAAGGSGGSMLDALNMDHSDPIIHLAIPVKRTPWPILQGISRTVVIDQVAPHTDVVMPQWLLGIVHTPDENRF